tara:strand:- start:2922 stop:3272 length:351 start_codon:yes stop_codon:yes gene_type:complete
MAESKPEPILEPIPFDFNNFQLNILYTNVTFARIAQNANTRIYKKSVLNFNPILMENNIGIFKIDRLGDIDAIVFERHFQNNKVIYNLANTAQTYYTKVQTPTGDEYIHPFDLNCK